MVKEKKSTGRKTLAVGAYQELASEIKSGKTRPIYLIFGDEEYLIERAIQALGRLLVAPGCMEVDYYRGEWAAFKQGLDSLVEIAHTPPFMSSKRLIIIRNSGLFGSKSPENQELSDKYVSFFRSIPESACVVFWEDKIDKRKKNLLEAISDSGILVQVDRQSPDSLCRWVATTLQKENIRITTEGINSLVDRTEGSMRVLSGEVQKLILFCRRSQLEKLDKGDIDKICMPDIRGSIFQMTDAIGARKTDRALEILDTLIAMKEPVPKIRFMLSRHLRQLICAKELGRAEEVISRLKVVPFVARNLVIQAKSFSLDDLLFFYEACALSDFAVKTGKIEDRLSLEIFLASCDKGAGRETFPKGLILSKV